MNTRGIRGFLALPIVGLIVIACSEEPVTEAPVVRPVKIVEIGGAGSVSTRELPGTIRAVQSADMAFEVGGRITELLVTEGQEVSAGTQLARLDSRDYQANYDQAAAAFRKAETDLARSERIYQQDTGAISASRIDAERNAVELTEAALRVAEKALQDTVLRAPFDGYVARRLVEDFQNVQPKQPVMILEDLSSLEIEVSVPERDVAESGQPQDLDERTQQIRPRVRVSAVPGSEYPARLIEFRTSADPATRTFRALLTIDVPEDQMILPGMTAHVVYDAAFLSGRITLPSHATFTDAEGNPSVWIADPTSMQVSRRGVTLGEFTAGDVQVLSGLSTGDLVVVSGVSQLREGMQIRRYEN